MKHTAFLLVGCFMFTLPVSGQMSWGGQSYYSTNLYFSPFVPVSFHDSVDITVAEGFTVTVAGRVTGNGHTMYKRGGGRFWFQADNPLFDGHIVYRGKSDTVRLDGIFGQFVNDSIGYLHAGKIFSSTDSISFFHLHQHDTVVQTFDASSYNRTNTNLYIYSDTHSTLRIIESSDSLAGRVHLSNGGRLYIDGTYNARIQVADSSRLITGENSIAGHRDYAAFANRIANDTAIVVNASTLQIGIRNRPSLVNVTAGHIVQRNSSMLKIDVYDPQASWDLTPGIYSSWKSDTDSSFSDRIYLAAGDYFFGAKSRIDVRWDSVYTASITDDSVFYLPVVMLNTSSQHIMGADSVTVHQNLPTWRLDFVIGDGNNGTVNGWGYVKGIRTLPDNIVDADCFVDPIPSNFSMKKLVSTTTNDIDVLTTPLIGDIDNDGEIEILHPSRVNTNSGLVVGSITELRIYGVKTSAPATPAAPQLYVKYTIPLAGIDFTSSGRPGVTPANFSNNTFYTFAKVDPPHISTGKQYAAIFLATLSGKLYKYELNPLLNQYEQKYSVVYNPSNWHYIGARPVLSDLMGDENVQVCILDKIYDARNLTLLATLRDASDNPVVKADNTLSSYSFGFIAHGVQFWGDNTYSEPSLVVSIEDTDGDGKKEIIAGDCVYKVNISNYSGETGNSYKLAVRANKKADLTTNIESRTDIYDGCGVVVDIDLDGKKDIVVASRGWLNSSIGYLYAYDPLTGKVKNTTVTSFPRLGNWAGGPSFPFIGDLNEDGLPEICFGAAANDLYAFSYDTIQHQFTQFWRTTTTDNTGCIGLSLFDFEQDNHPEIVYRDNNHLYIWDGAQNPPVDVNPPVTGGLNSTSAAEYPVVADVNGDGAADIIVTGGGANGFYGDLHIFTSNGAPWAPARPVWHMSPSQPLYINEDLTVPKHPISPVTRFPGKDGVFGTPDDMHPYNNFMQQQTLLNTNGNTLWLAPDAIIRGTITDVTTSGVSVTVKAGIINHGDAAIGAPVHITLYNNDTLPGRKIVTASANILILPGDTGYVEATISNIIDTVAIAVLKGLTHIVVRINDDGTTFPHYTECDTSNNVLKILHPSIRLLMAKNARVNGVGPTENGTYPNPVSVFGSEEIEYQVIARNVNLATGNVVIRDTLPAYLNFAGVQSSSSGGVFAPLAQTGGVPQRDILKWDFTGVLPNAVVDVTYRVTPASGVCASQPLFINRAYITVSDTIHVETNDTYHQGAGISLVTFSASLGGSLYNAAPQAIDYRTSPHAGVVVAPEAGYRFAGWTHDAYTSLRAVPVPARSGVMHLDTLMIYGDVELRAVFELEEYPICYYLNGGANGAGNPSAYTVVSNDMALSPAFREDDVFVGWTGSNGEEPQLKVTITGGSMGTLHFYANYLYNGREVEPAGFSSSENEDKVWAFEGDLYVRTARSGSVVRIYTADGVLQKIQTLLTAGETKIGLPRGVYVVTLNNGVGQKILIFN